MQLRGKIDRIHKIDDKIYAVDYKTAKVSDSDLKWDKPDQIKKKTKITQLMIYNYLMAETYNSAYLVSEIYSLGATNSLKPKPLQGKMLANGLSDILIDESLQALAPLFDEIFDENRPFELVSIE